MLRYFVATVITTVAPLTTPATAQGQVYPVKPVRMDVSKMGKIVKDAGIRAD